MKEYVEKYQSYFYFVFRVLVGLLFLGHGLQKFGVFGGNAMPLASLMGVAGVIEIVAGVAITVGLFTRSLALISAVQMLVAYFKVHAPNGMIPLLNKGEPALLFFAAFLVLAGWGAGKWNLEKVFFKEEKF